MTTYESISQSVQWSPIFKRLSNSTHAVEEL
jgi:hypothetical protein